MGTLILYMITRWVKLSDLNFNIVNVPIEYKLVDKLNQCQGSYFC